jgi:hypothetical protein
MTLKELEPQLLALSDIANAWAYAVAFPDEIEAEIEENNAVMNQEI